MPPVCQLCKRERTEKDRDYSPVQVVLNTPIGWYTGDDGEICGGCMTNIIRNQ